MQNNDRKRRKEIPRQASLLATSQTGLGEETRWMGGTRVGRGEQEEVEGTRSVGLIDVGLTISPLGPSISTFRDMLCSSCCLLPSLMSAVSLCVSICFRWGRWEEGEVDGVCKRGREREDGRMEGRKAGEYMCCRGILQFLKRVEPQYCWHVLAATG